MSSIGTASASSIFSSKSSFSSVPMSATTSVSSVASSSATAPSPPLQLLQQQQQQQHTSLHKRFLRSKWLRGSRSSSIEGTGKLSLSSLQSKHRSLDECRRRLSADRAVIPDPRLNSRRRTVILERSALTESFGFALQSYVYKRDGFMIPERVTYVDYVNEAGHASKAGLKHGDVVVAVNGISVVQFSHAQLVALLAAQLTARLVLLSDNMAKGIALSARSLRLQFVLAEKMKRLEAIDAELHRLEAKSRLEETLTAAVVVRRDKGVEKANRNSKLSSSDADDADSGVSAATGTDDESNTSTRHDEPVEVTAIGTAFTHSIRVIDDEDENEEFPQVTRL